MIGKLVLIAAALLGLGCAGARAENPKPRPASPGFAPFAGTSSKEPIAIEADRLEVFDKEQRAVYTGNVVVRQGDTVMKSAQMIVFYDRAPESPGAPRQEAQGDSQTNLRKVEAKGGVSVASKTQVATGNEGVYDRARNRIVLTGNVALSDGPNVTTGEKLNYDLTTGVAVIERGGSTRVKGLFMPSDSEKSEKKDKPAVKTN